MKGEGNQQDYGMRIYDPRVGRFLSVDPITKEYPELTPYQFASNTPVWAVDLDGLEMEPFQSMRVEQKIRENRASMTPEELKRDKQLELQIGIGVSALPVSIYGAVVAAPVLATASVSTISVVSSASTSALVWASRNPQAIQTTSEFLFGALYDGPDDLFPGRGADDAGKTAAQGIKKIPRIVSELFSDRRSLANAFYKAAGFTDDLVRASHIKGIDMGKAVETVTLKAGTEINQWVNVERGIGNYFTTADNVMENLGIGDYAQRVLKTFKLTKDVKVLKSTAAEFDGNAGGGTQYFSTELKNVLEEVIKN